MNLLHCTYYYALYTNYNTVWPLIRKTEKSCRCWRRCPTERASSLLSLRGFGKTTTEAKHQWKTASETMFLLTLEYQPRLLLILCRSLALKAAPSTPTPFYLFFLEFPRCPRSRPITIINSSIIKSLRSSKCAEDGVLGELGRRETIYPVDRG